MVTAVIVFYRGVDLLRRCLDSLAGSDSSLDVVVVSTSPDPPPRNEVQPAGLAVTWIEAPENPGYGAACNLGAAGVETPYLMFLNSDVELAASCVGALVAAADEDPRVGALQPKLYTAGEPGRFDYGGAAGGLVDAFGYPFARGRLFSTLETDDGAYDHPTGIFWPAGSVFFTRAEAFQGVGGFDPDFFLYMEEIDLAWRLHMAGWDVRLAPAAIAHHAGPRQIGHETPDQLYWNHRNSLILLIKNLSAARLALVLPLRLVLELVTVIAALAWRDVLRARAVLRSLAWLARHPLRLRTRRRTTRELRRTGAARAEARLYPGSVVWEYFVRRRRRARDLRRQGGNIR